MHKVSEEDKLVTKLKKKSKKIKEKQVFCYLIPWKEGWEG